MNSSVNIIASIITQVYLSFTSNSGHTFTNNIWITFLVNLIFWPCTYCHLSYILPNLQSNGRINLAFISYQDCKSTASHFLLWYEFLLRTLLGCKHPNFMIFIENQCVEDRRICLLLTLHYHRITHNRIPVGGQYFA